MKRKKYLILNMNPGFDQWHMIRKEPTVQGVYRADHVLRMISGKGLNVARVLRNLGFLDYTCVNILGGRIGSIISELSIEEHLNCLEYYIGGESRINTCVMMEYNKETISYNDPGPVLTREEVSGFRRFLIEKASGMEDTAAVISGAPCQGMTARDFLELLEAMRQQGHELIVDVSGVWLEMASRYPLKLLKVNREEFREAFDIDAFLFTEDLKRFKDERQIRNLVVTDGKNGSVVYGENGECFWCGTKEIQGGSFSVGSGDSFLGGYLIKAAQNESLQTCLIYASMCGLANTYQYGPAMIEKAEIEKFGKYITVVKKEEGVI